jgi:hypothetical protein
MLGFGYTREEIKASFELNISDEDLISTMTIESEDLNVLPF